MTSIGVLAAYTVLAFGFTACCARGLSVRRVGIVPTMKGTMLHAAARPVRRVPPAPPGATLDARCHRRELA